MSELLETCTYVPNLADLEAVARTAYEAQRKANKAGEKQLPFDQLEDDFRAEMLADIEMGNSDAIAKRGPVFACVAGAMQGAIADACVNLMAQSEPGDEVVAFKSLEPTEPVILWVDQARALPLSESEEATAYETQDPRAIRSFRDEDGTVRFVVQEPDGSLAKR